MRVTSVLLQLRIPPKLRIPPFLFPDLQEGGDSYFRSWDEAKGPPFGACSTQRATGAKFLRFPSFCYWFSYRKCVFGCVKAQNFRLRRTMSSQLLYNQHNSCIKPGETNAPKARKFLEQKLDMLVIHLCDLHWFEANLTDHKKWSYPWSGSSEFLSKTKPNSRTRSKD